MQVFKSLNTCLYAFIYWYTLSSYLMYSLSIRPIYSLSSKYNMHTAASLSSNYNMHTAALELQDPPIHLSVCTSCIQLKSFNWHIDAAADEPQDHGLFPTFGYTRQKIGAQGNVQEFVIYVCMCLCVYACVYVDWSQKSIQACQKRERVHLWEGWGGLMKCHHIIDANVQLHACLIPFHSYTAYLRA